MTKHFAQPICSCTDKGCEEHEGAASCTNIATYTLYRLGIEDTSGAAFCTNCAINALESGLYGLEQDKDE